MGWLSDIDLGDLPTWLQAVVTGFALYFAYRAASSAGRQADSAQEQAKIAQAQANAAQAQVTAAQEQLRSARDDAAAAAVERQERRLSAERAQAEACSMWVDDDGRVFVSNASQSPIYNCVLWVQARDNGQLGYTNYRHVIPPSPSPQHLAEFDGDLSALMDDLRDLGEDVTVRQGWHTGMCFTDSSGRPWERHRDGRLTPWAEQA